MIHCHKCSHCAPRACLTRCHTRVLEKMVGDALFEMPGHKMPSHDHLSVKLTSFLLQAMLRVFNPLLPYNLIQLLSKIKHDFLFIV